MKKTLLSWSSPNWFARASGSASGRKLLTSDETSQSVPFLLRKTTTSGFSTKTLMEVGFRNHKSTTSFNPLPRQCRDSSMFIIHGLRAIVEFNLCLSELVRKGIRIRVGLSGRKLQLQMNSDFGRRRRTNVDYRLIRRFRTSPRKRNNGREITTE